MGEFEFYRDEMLGELSPAGAMESMLAERVVGLAWRLRRAERIQAEVFDAMLAQDAADPVAKLVRSMRAKGADGASALSRVVVRDFANARVLDRLGLYERRIEHSLYKNLDEFQRMRLVRELDEGNHRQAALDAATPSPPEAPSRTEDEPLRQTKPISRVLGHETRFGSKSKANSMSVETPAIADSGCCRGGRSESGDRYNPLRGTYQSPFSQAVWRAPEA